MTDRYYQTVNRAIVQGLTEDDELRESARSALHHIFGRENRLRWELEKANQEIERQGYKLSRQMTELDQLREAFDVITDANEAKAAELDRLREAVRIKGESLRACQDAVSRLREVLRVHAEDRPYTCADVLASGEALR